MVNQLTKMANEHKARQGLANRIETTEDTASHKLLNGEYEKLLAQAINQLSDRQQEVYRLAKEQGMTYEQIATQLSMSPLTVKTHLSRAMDGIRNFLQEHGGLFALLLMMQKKIF